MENQSTLKDLCFCVHGAGQMLANPQVRKALSLPEIEEELSLLDQVKKIKNLLTKENWVQGRWFKSVSDRSEVRAADVNFVDADAAVDVAAVAADAAFAVAARAADRAASAASERIALDSNKDLFTIWQNRPNSVKNNYISSFNKNYGNFNLHYLLEMFGITTAYNDDKATTLQDLHAKLDEVIAFAEEHSL